jgi:hypothetical protein
MRFLRFFAASALFSAAPLLATAAAASFKKKFDDLHCRTIGPAVMGGRIDVAKLEALGPMRIVP